MRKLYGFVGVLLVTGLLVGGSIIQAGIFVGILLLVTFAMEFSSLTERTKTAILRARLLIDTIVTALAIGTIGLSTVTSVIGVAVVSLGVSMGLHYEAHKRGLAQGESLEERVKRVYYTQEGEE